MMKPVPKPPPPHIVIVGGGLAGLAVASRLVDRGLRITLLESRPRLGGRASSFPDPVTGELVDNCQHVSMACCTNLADFCRRVGIDGLFRREPELVFLGPEGRVSRFRAGLAPAPFHLAGSFLSASFLNLREKIRVAYGLACLARGREDRPGEPFADWLWRHGQNLRTINLFWAAVLVSALNERLDQMDTGHARKVFLDGFLRNRTGFQLELPRVPLGELYGTRLEGWLRDHGVAVRLTTGVRAVEPDDDDAIGGVVLRHGERLAADFVVLAVPFDRVQSLLPDALRGRLPALDRVAAMQASPITGVHLWFDRPVCPFDHVVTPGRLIQWVFNHTAIQGRSGRAAATPGPRGAAADSSGGGGQYLQVVISASYDLLALDKLAIRDLVLADLAELWPVARSAQLLRWWVVTEHGATFAVRPGIEGLRPPQRTAIDGLFLAGDWTDTGWPATMEGAVRSGYLAAQEILSVLDRPARLIRPGLKAGALARWLIGTTEFRPSCPVGPTPPAVPEPTARASSQSCPVPNDRR
ncbi:MAG TPA: hydroxysqualene dehydroxylase HpnE [Isosphaeraceae bacterium]|nr:hydroxysqualene dehydroxylase HpnE [Isosphaeraceae bacterium]